MGRRVARGRGSATGARDPSPGARVRAGRRRAARTRATAPRKESSEEVTGPFSFAGYPFLLPSPTALLASASAVGTPALRSGAWEDGVHRASTDSNDWSSLRSSSLNGVAQAVSSSRSPVKWRTTSRQSERILTLSTRLSLARRSPMSTARNSASGPQLTGPRGIDSASTTLRAGSQRTIPAPPVDFRTRDLCRSPGRAEPSVSR